jgi:hypothetical protein
MPTNTDLVTDLPADFEVFGQAVDTSMADLKGGTTGQILSKTTNADMDFTWIANDQGDITGVTATSPLTGGGTSGAITVGIQDATTSVKGSVQLSDSTSTTSSVLAATPTAVKSAYDLANAAIAKSTLTTAGDTLYRNATVPTRLGIGTAGQVLTVNSGATAPEWSYGGKSTAFTTTWGVVSGTAPSLGNGALTAKYTRVGDFVYFAINLVAGSTTTFGSGTYTFTLPFAMTATENGIAGDASALDAGVAWYRGFTPNSVEFGLTDKFIMVNNAGTPMSNSGPFTFGNADSIKAWGSYVI